MPWLIGPFLQGPLSRLSPVICFLRPNLLVHLGFTRYLIDNLISHPLAPSHVARAHQPLGTASYAETRKRRTYGELARRIGANFMLFSCEYFGAIGECASTFIKRLCTHAGQFSPWTYAVFLPTLPIVFIAPSFKPSQGPFLST